MKQDEVTVINELLEDVLASDNLARAWKRVKANKGAPGIDGMTIEDFPAHARTHWSAVREQIREGRYQPQAVRRVEIPKPGSLPPRRRGAANGCWEYRRSWTG